MYQLIMFVFVLIKTVCILLLICMNQTCYNNYETFFKMFIPNITYCA